MKKRIFIAAIFPPRTELTVEGLGRYYETLVKSSDLWLELNKEYQVVLAVARWHSKWANAITDGTQVKVETFGPRTPGGLLLHLWSKSNIFDLVLEFKIFLFSRHAISWTIHKWSAGVFGSSNSNFFSKKIQKLQRFIAKSILWMVKNRRAKSVGSFTSEVEVLLVVKSHRIDSRQLFDRFYRIESQSILDRVNMKSEFIFLAHNRLEPPANAQNIAILVPDLIPLEFSGLFEKESTRWKQIQKEIIKNCASSKKWICFSSHTSDYARDADLLTEMSKIHLVPHGNRPPNYSWDQYFEQSKRGVGPEWVDYWWRSGLKKVSNNLFYNFNFNNQLEYCIYPTQFRPHKGIVELIESWKNVVREIPTFKLVLTADPVKNTDLLNIVVKLGLEMSVLFVPNLSEEELIAWTIRSKLVISASEAEGAMPFMVSEAMAAETPFLIRDLDVSKEVIPFEIQDICFFKNGELAESIVRSLKHRDEILAAQMKWNNGYVRSWETVWAEWMAVATESLND
jgi:glycosyltransferase involved in cell wall biosynthesis